jgi:hypothetical protein
MWHWHWQARAFALNGYALVQLAAKGTGGTHGS